MKQVMFAAYALINAADDENTKQCVASMDQLREGIELCKELGLIHVDP